MGLLTEFARRYGGRRWFAAVVSRIAPPLDRLASAVTGGRRTLSDAALPTLVLIHTGRTSGAERRTPLLRVEADRGWAVVGTNFGKPEHPQWARNLLARPEAAVLLHGTTTPVTARLATQGERTALWPRFVALYPAYAAYTARLGREAHLFVLEPRSRRPAPHVGPVGDGRER